MTPSRSLHSKWSPLLIYAAYRFLLSILLILLYFTLFPSSNPLFSKALYLGGALFYSLLCMASILLIQHYETENKILKFSITVSDIIIITLLAHATGGLNSNLSILLVVAVAAGGIMIVGRAGTLIAAIATIAVLYEQAYFALVHGKDVPFTDAGFLGIAFFAVSLFSQNIAKQLGESEARASASEANLAAWQAISHQVIQRMRTGILVLSPQGELFLANTTAHKLLDCSEPLPTNTALESICEPLYKQLTAWLEDRDTPSQPFKVKSNGPAIQCNFTELTESELTGNISTSSHNNNQVLAFLEDTTTLAQQAQHLKLASLATLTAGIAHEIRNPLGAISHAAQLLLESPDLDKADLKLANIVQQHSIRMNNIIENVLYLSRRKKPNPTMLNLNEWLHTFLTSFKESYGQTCDIHIEQTQNEVIINIDSSHLSQILTNLMENGLRYSKQQTDNASLTICVGCKQNNELPYIQIHDDGPGINEEQHSHLFEPFYTSESNGTGLGLYLARELCEINHARLDVKMEMSEEEKLTDGCCFEIIFAHPKKKTPEKELVS